MARLFHAALLIALTISTIAWLSCVGDPPETLVDPLPVAVLECAPAVPLGNPCAEIDCHRVDTKEYA